jgi:hypothetical protein
MHNFDQLREERRGSSRYVLSLPVSYVWQGDDGQHHGEGITRDIGTSGMFVVASLLPRQNAIVQAEVSLVTATGNMKIESSGVVVRVEAGVGERLSGFGLQSSGLFLFDQESRHNSLLKSDLGCLPALI